MRSFKNLIESLFPERCYGCGLRGFLVCPACLAALPPAEAPADPFIASIYAYHDFRVHSLIKKLKYGRRKDIAKVFAPALAGAISEFLGEEGSFIGSRAVLLVPVPLSGERMRKRGYNQAELLAKEALALLPGNGETIFLDTRLLRKIRETPPQARMKRKSERLHNLGGCFAVGEGRTCAGEVVLLVDDVTTTGATLEAARAALRARGFKNVHAFTIAH